MKISVITLFPEMFSSPFNSSIIKRAVEKGLVELEFIDIRDFGIGKHKLVDDTPYGGGAGMVLRVDVLFDAIEKAKDKKYKKSEEKIILLTASGKTFNQKTAKRYSKLKHLILVCGHYEGVDERIIKYLDEQVSIGDFVLTGGEIPAMLIVDSVVRLIKGVITDKSLANESFGLLLEHPQYTKPSVYKGAKVPDVLISGNHAKIDAWKKEQSLKLTQKVRPDLIKK
ncbi:MAG: tRNA (guanosine(37)-N1)-methyltransferase TrmD [Candidatus Levybacteria bacterium]|nr:tRNA (guanosine(37)-N1)-methyltransferase TrmD [Candidatus Levybacteria bacterium]